ncbi:hypothetical protein [Streptomyces goshikiensis]|uniref:hypothetical protein n=1 Tax=Streptomyces goshikiensis TaxID=1942 RepID=UPI00369F1A26
MNSSHQVSISSSSGAPPETAAIRFMALLPAGWHAEVGELGEHLARLVIAAPPGTTATQTTEIAAGILSQPGLQDWQLADH